MQIRFFTAGLAAAMVVGSAGAAVISVNTTDGGPGAGAADAGNTAGAVLVGNWNTLTNGGTGTSGTNAADLLDDAGNNSGVGISQSAGTGGWYQSTTGFSGTIGNKVMENFADTSSSYSYTFTGVNAGVGALYDVYIYTARGFANTGVSQFDVNGQTLFLVNESITGDYTESGFATEALAETNPDAGNYVRFRNVSLDTLTIGVTGLVDDVNGGNLAAVNAIQLVQVPEPGSMALLAMGGLLIARRRRA